VAANAGVHRDVRERAVAVVAKQGIREATIQGRRAGHPLAGGSTSPGCLERPVEVVAHEQIQLAVPVVVEPGCPDRPRLLARGRRPRDTGLACDIGKRAVPVVPVERVVVHAGDEQVGVAVVVVVARGHAHVVAGSGDRGPLGDVRERAVAVVVIEAVPVPAVALGQ
jgi:hypothetical protein